MYHWLPSKRTLTKANTVKLTKKSAYEDQEEMDEDRLAILYGVATFKVGIQVKF